MLQWMRAVTPRALSAFLMYFLCLKALYLVLPVPPAFDGDGVLSGFLANPYVSTALTVLLLGIMALWLNAAMLNIEFYTVRTYYVAAMFILISSTGRSFQILGDVFLSSLILLGVLTQLLQIVYREKAKQEHFNMGLLFGIAVMFHSPVIFLFPFLTLAIYFLKPFRPGEWALMVIAGCLPLYFIYSLDFIFQWGSLPVSPFDLEEVRWFGRHMRGWEMAAPAAAAVLVLIAMFSMVRRYGTSTVRIKRTVRALFSMMAGTVIVILFSGYTGWQTFSFLLPYGAIMLAQMLLRIPNIRAAEILHIIFVLLILVNQVIIGIL